MGVFPLPFHLTIYRIFLQIPPSVSVFEFLCSLEIHFLGSIGLKANISIKVESFAKFFLRWLQTFKELFKLLFSLIEYLDFLCFIFLISFIVGDIFFSFLNNLMKQSSSVRVLSTLHPFIN